MIQKEIALKWQKVWKEKKAFFPKNSKNKFFITTPYPYISGSLHIGHGRAVSEADIIARYKRMNGHSVLYPLGFHITGTPVLGISSAIKAGNKKMIEMYKKYISNYESDPVKIKQILKSFEEPQNIVDFFIPKMINEYSSLGLSIDWTKTFTSGDMSHQQLVTWQFQKYKELDYLKTGSHPVLYCPEDGNAMGEDDIKDADSDPVEKQEFTLLKFKYEDLFFVAGTLRPETVFGQTNLWINPDASYVTVEVQNEKWVMSKKAAFKLSYQIKDTKILNDFDIKKVIGKEVLAPAINKKIPILPGDFVDENKATGIVTSVPSDAPYDLVALLELKNKKDILEKYNIKKLVETIEVIPIIKTKKYGENAAVKLVDELKITSQSDPRLDELTKKVYKEGFHSGVMLENAKEFSNLKVIVAKEKIKNMLLEKKLATTFFETSRVAYSRSGAEVIVAILDDQWFIDFNSEGWKEKAFKLLNKIELLPSSYKKQFEDNFDWLDKRPCARRRGLGTKFPFDKEWIIESLSDSTIYMTLYTIQDLIIKYELKREQLNYDFFEYVFLESLNIEEASKKTGVKKEILQELRQRFKEWMPQDLRHTFELHLSNHLSFMIFAHAAIFPEELWPKKISFHGLIISDGVKMSKSKGNVISLLDIREEFGPDNFRFYITQNTTLEGTFDWKEKEAQNAKNTVLKIQKELELALEQKSKGDVSSLYKSKFNKIIKKATNYLEELKTREYNNTIAYEMLNLIKDAKNNLSTKELSHFYEYITADWIKLISPVIPHTAEELYSKLNKEELVSLSSWPSFDESLIDEKEEYLDDLSKSLIEDVNSLKQLLKIKPKTLKIVIADSWKYDFLERFKKLSKQKHDPKFVISEIMKSDLKSKGNFVIKLISNYFKNPNKIPLMNISSQEEKSYVQKTANKLKSNFDFNVEIVEESQIKDSKNPLPGKPALIFE